MANLSEQHSTPRDSEGLRVPIDKGPRVFLVCGFIGSGKTTASIELARTEGAMRLTLDEWVNKLYGPEATHITAFDPQERVKEVMWQVAHEAMRRGVSVVLDWGFWTRAERDAYRAKCDAVGFPSVLIFIQCEKSVCLDRTRQRNALLDEMSVAIDLGDFERWWPKFEAPLDEMFEGKST